MKIAFRSSRSSLWLVAIAATLAAGCGYHFAAAGSGLPPGAETVYVDRFANRSRITGLNDRFARYLKDEIASHKRLRVVDDPASADLTLSGAIVGDETQPTIFNAVVEPTQYSEQLIVNASLKDNRTDKTVWSIQRMGSSQFYAVVPQAVTATAPQFLQQNLRSRDINRLPDVQAAQTERVASQDQLMTNLAHNLYASMSEGF